jgi:hypothetical protein
MGGGRAVPHNGLSAWGREYRRKMPTKDRYTMIGFGKDGPIFERGLTSDEAQDCAEKADLDGYLLHPPWLARRKKREEERTYRYGTPTDKPYKQTSCRRMMFTVLLNRNRKDIPNDEEIRTK